VGGTGGVGLCLDSHGHSIRVDASHRFVRDVCFRGARRWLIIPTRACGSISTNGGSSSHCSMRSIGAINWIRLIILAIAVGIAITITITIAIAIAIAIMTIISRAFIVAAGTTIASLHRAFITCLVLGLGPVSLFHDGCKTRWVTRGGTFWLLRLMLQRRG